ncbi:MAG: DNA-directed RNA polymerase subunit beta' [Clostridia bacterium]|nr:DNA-directed RNA polymerase subunit beta' [Clostridia bacterium]
MFEVNNFDSIKIGLASPEKIREWSHGEVKKPETINYRTQKPEPDGLFCQKIFGPTKDWECACGKYKRIRHKGVVCDKCGVKVEQSRVRRERMGHIELAAPVAHLWYLKGTPSRIATILDMPPKEVEHVIYYASYVVMDPGTTGLYKKQVLNEAEFREACEQYGRENFTVGMGAESIKQFLMEVDIEGEIATLRAAIAKDQNSVKENSQAPKRMKMAKRLEILEAFRETGNKPEWMILEALPVLPPELRPMIPLEGGRYATSDLNDLYRYVIGRNNRLKNFLQSGGVDAMIRNEKRMLQVAVDNLIDNTKRAKSTSGKSRELKSLTAMLRGKQGRFRQNLLGKRVDYSGRSVIVVGPELKMYQCGLPKEMALELFKPFIMKELVERNICNNIRNAKRYVERARAEVWDVLDDVIKDHPVLLNRAPTLHRLGIQAFEPVLVEGRALKLHPLACTAFNADFDGDQMAVHVPLSIEAQAEARFLMLSTNNILKLSDGQPIVSPTQDMILGSYYLTIERPFDPQGEDESDLDYKRRTNRSFMSVAEAKMAYQTKNIGLQNPIRVWVSKEIDGKVHGKFIQTTVGRLIFNEAIPQDIGFVPRDTVDQQLDLEVSCLMTKGKLKELVDKCYKAKGNTETAAVLDRIKALGYKYSTLSGLTTCVFDMHIPAEKQQIIADADREVAKIQRLYDRGFITNEERERKVVEVWNDVTDRVSSALKDCLDTFNPIKMMQHSGARGSMDQIRQLSGMRGLMKDPTGKVIELPVKSNFREGLSALEYFISSHGGRKGLADTALKTAESGYLTRRLVDVAQPIIIREEDCGDRKGTEVETIYGSRDQVIEHLRERLVGRYSVADIVDPTTGEVLVEADTMISVAQAKAIEDAGIKKVRIRSVLACKRAYGICAKCYGADMSNGKLVKIGEAVGTIAAQSIGEPGTQLTMRTFHTGGVAGADDITAGLPRVEELFECRNPKAQAIISDIAGKVTRTEKDKRTVITVEPIGGGDSKTYNPAYNAKILVEDGQIVEPGTQLTAGSINLQDLLRTKSAKGVQDYLTWEVKKAYQSSGVAINDKHIEIIIRQMLRKVRIEKPGDTRLLPGELVDIARFEEINMQTVEAGGEPAIAKRCLLGITKASLASDSFLAAASFQETTRVLTDAAIKGKVDPLLGLKENVILGKLIPAGTGLKQYSNITAMPVSNIQEAEIEIPDIDDEE